MMPPAPDPAEGPFPDPSGTRLVVELNNLRDALVGLSLLVRDYLCELDSTQRDQAAADTEQAIECAKASACQPPRRL